MCFKAKKMEELNNIVDTAIAHHGLAKQFKERQQLIEKLDKSDTADDQDNFISKFGSRS